MEYREKKAEQRAFIAVLCSARLLCTGPKRRSARKNGLFGRAAPDFHVVICFHYTGRHRKW